jgi:hypothetical protein
MVCLILLSDDGGPIARTTTRRWAPRRMRAMSRTRFAACAALITLATAGTAQAAKVQLPVLRTYEVRIALQMQSDFSFQHDPVGCNGRLPMGYDGAGQEIMKMSSPKPVLVQTFYARGEDPSVMRKDLKPAFPIAGTSKRSGGMTQVVCDTNPPSKIEPCLGEFPVHDEMELRFYKGKFQISTNTVQDTHSLIAGCGNDSFDWDGATARTGDVLTQTAEGPAPAKKFKTGSFSLRALDREQCVVTDFGASGACATTWSYQVNFRRVTKKVRRKLGI